jgi:hypothetical protein
MEVLATQVKRAVRSGGKRWDTAEKNKHIKRFDGNSQEHEEFATM